MGQTTPMLCPTSGHGPQHSFQILYWYNEALQRYDLTPFFGGAISPSMSAILHWSFQKQYMTLEAVSKESHDKNIMILGQTVAKSYVHFFLNLYSACKHWRYSVM